MRAKFGLLGGMGLPGICVFEDIWGFIVFLVLLLGGRGWEMEMEMEMEGDKVRKVSYGRKYGG